MTPRPDPETPFPSGGLPQKSLLNNMDLYYPAMAIVVALIITVLITGGWLR